MASLAQGLPWNVARKAKDQWSSLTPEQKREVLVSLGEWVGGTAGSVAGAGWLSVPGAGAGAVAGHNAGELLSDAVGYPRKKRSAVDELKEQSNVFALNAAGEGVGRAVPMVARAAKTKVKNLVKMPFTPSAERAAVNAKIDAAGIPTTVGMRTDKPLPQMVEQALEHSLAGSGPIRAARQAAEQSWEAQLRAIPESLAPESATAQEVGEALQLGRESNLDAMRGYFGPKYDEIGELAGDLEFTPTNMATVAREIREANPWRSSPVVNRAAAMSPANVLDEVAQSLGAPNFAGVTDPRQQALIQNIAATLPGGGPQRVSYEQLKNLRTQLLEAQRGIDPKSSAFDRQAIPRMVQAVDADIEAGLAANPEALQKFRYISDEYADASSRINSPTAIKIQRETMPERLPQTIASKPTALQEAEAALSPMYDNAAPNPMDSLRRQQGEELINKSRTQQHGISDDAPPNPRTLEKAISGTNQRAETARALLGDQPYQQMMDSVEIGKAITQPQATFGNLSRTAPMGAVMKYGANALAMAGGAVGAIDDKKSPVERFAMVAGPLAATRMAGKAMASPAVARWLTSGAERVAWQPGGAVAGAVGRAFSVPMVSPMPEAQASGAVLDENGDPLPIDENGDPLPFIQ